MKTIKVGDKEFPKQIVLIGVDPINSGWKVIEGQILTLEYEKGLTYQKLWFRYINENGMEKRLYLYPGELGTIFKYLPADKYQKMKVFI